MSADLKGKTLSSLAWKLFERGGSALVSMVVQIVMARLLMPSDFGMLAIILVFINIGNVIVQSGLNTALIQSPKIEENDYSTVFWMSLTISVVLYAVIFLSAPFIGEFYDMEGLVWPLRIISLMLIVNSFNSVQVAIITRDLELKKIFRSTIISVVVSGAIGIGLALVGFRLWALVAQQIMYQVISCVVMKMQISWFPRFVFDAKRAREMFSFGWKLLVSGIMDSCYQGLSDLIIGKQFTSKELGYVSQGQRYPQAIGYMLDGSIQPVMLSAVAHVQDDLEQVKRLVRRALKTSTYLIMPAMGLFAVVAEPLVLVLLGEKWLPAVPFLQMNCFIFMLLPIHTTNLQALNGMGRSDLFLKLEFIKKGYGLAILCFAAFVLHNVYAIVAGFMLSGLISTFVNAYPSKKVIGYSYTEQLKDVSPAVVLTVVSAAAAWAVGLASLPPVITIVFQCIVMVALFLGCSAAFHVESFQYLKSTALEMLKGKLGRMKH